MTPFSPNATIIHGTNLYLQKTLNMFNDGSWKTVLATNAGLGLDISSDGFADIVFKIADPGTIATFTTDLIDFKTHVWARGNLTATNGHLTVATAGKKLRIKEDAAGGSASMGTNRIAGGDVTVSTTAVAANSRIFISNISPNGDVGFPYIHSITPGVGFVITNTSATDNSILAWWIIDPAP
jgi:hypothetical protein